MTKGRKALSAVGPLLACAIIAAGAIGFAGAAPNLTDHLPEEMEAPPRRPLAGELLASVPNVPTPRPEIADGNSDAQKGDAMPREELSCRANLIATGVRFEAVPEIVGDGQCGIAFPIMVSSLGAGIELNPDGVMNCAVAEAAARLVRDTVRPAAQAELGSELAGVRHASTYVCRNRASGEKISEHARGNAFDVSAFLLEDGRVVEVEAYGPADMPERRFMRTVRREACGPFRTVLGPGADADHALHFHFDLAERRRGSTYCR